MQAGARGPPVWQLSGDAAYDSRANVGSMVTDAAWDRFHAALDMLGERVRGDERFAAEHGPVSVSWHHAGGVVADLRAKNHAQRASASYLDYYCSGGDGTVSEEVAAELGALGWSSLPWPADRLA